MDTKASIEVRSKLTGLGLALGFWIGVVAGTGTGGFLLSKDYAIVAAAFGALFGGIGGALLGVPTAHFTYTERVSDATASTTRVALRVLRSMVLVVIVLGVFTSIACRSYNKIIPGVVLFAISISVCSFFGAQIFERVFVRSFDEIYEDYEGKFARLLYSKIFIFSILLGCAGRVAISLGVL